MQRRSNELTALFKRLYEDNVLGRITNEQFRRLSADYNAEQKTLEDAIPVKLERLEKGEQPVNLVAPPRDIDEIVKMLA